MTEMNGTTRVQETVVPKVLRDENLADDRRKYYADGQINISNLNHAVKANWRQDHACFA